MFINYMIHNYLLVIMNWHFPGGLDSKESACNSEDLGSIPKLKQSPGEAYTIFHIYHKQPVQTVFIFW